MSATLYYLLLFSVSHWVFPLKAETLQKRKQIWLTRAHTCVRESQVCITSSFEAPSTRERERESVCDAAMLSMFLCFGLNSVPKVECDAAPVSRLKTKHVFSTFNPDCRSLSETTGRFGQEERLWKDSGKRWDSLPLQVEGALEAALPGM